MPCLQLLDGPAADDQPSEADTEVTTVSESGNTLDTDNVRTLLLPGGITVRSGPWHLDGGNSGTSATAAGAGAAATPTGTGGAVSTAEKTGWAVEVGWFLGVEKADERRKERVVITTVLDARTMTPLAVWKREEKRA